MLTDSVLSSYRDTLAEELAGSAGRVADIGQEGLPLGVQLMDEKSMESRLRGAPDGAPLGPAVSHPSAADATAFLEAEAGALRRAAEALGNSPRGSEGADILADIDYTWVHFPDLPDMQGPAPGFVARARVAASWYAQRLERSISPPRS